MNPEKNTRRGASTACDVCRDGAGAVLAREIVAMQEHGWYVHYVPDDATCPYRTNIHTHGLEESLGHADLQIVLPISPEAADSVLHAAVGLIRDGIRFHAGQVSTGILQERFPVAFARAFEGGRTVLRMILCDIAGSLDPAEMDPLYSGQWRACAVGP